jgi:Xaa-Pro aminopeptidase
MVSVTQNELTVRIGKLQHYLSTKEIDLAILNVNSDLYYYIGSIQPLYLLVPAEGQPLLLARKSMQRIREEAAHIKLEPFSGTKDLIRIIGENGFAGAKKLGLTFETTAYATILRWQQLFSNAELVDLSWDIRALRMVKSEFEIAIQARAGVIMAKVPSLIRKNFIPGMTELELSAIIENYFRLNGHGVLVRCRREGIEMSFGVCSAGINTLAGTKFDGICAGVGISAAMPYGAGYAQIRRGIPVLLDYAYNLEGYHVDQTRMFSWGEPSSEVLRAYDAMLQVEGSIVNRLKPGQTWGEIYDAALQLAVELGYEKEFMGLEPEKVKFVGHGVGLELDEPPFLAPKNDFPLMAGMVVAVEPKVSLPGVGVIGIEDTLVIRENSPEAITTAANEFLVL